MDKVGKKKGNFGQNSKTKNAEKDKLKESLKRLFKKEQRKQQNSDHKPGQTEYKFQDKVNDANNVFYRKRLNDEASLYADNAKSEARQTKQPFSFKDKKTSQQQNSKEFHNNKNKNNKKTKTPENHAQSEPKSAQPNSSNKTKKKFTKSKQQNKPKHGHTNSTKEQPDVTSGTSKKKRNKYKNVKANPPNSTSNWQQGTNAPNNSNSKAAKAGNKRHWNNGYNATSNQSKKFRSNNYQNNGNDFASMSGFVAGGEYHYNDADAAEDFANWQQYDDYVDDNQNDYDDGADFYTVEDFHNEYDEYDELGYGEEQLYDNDNDEEYDEEYFDSGEEEFFDSEEEEFETEENYSDFDEDDYEEEEDSFDYDQDDFDEEYNVDDSFNGEDDKDYTLPPSVLEDLIIHRGTAEKRPLEAKDNIQFDSDNDDPQIIELAQQPAVKCIQQPLAYSKTELLKLTYCVESLSLVETKRNAAISAAAKATNAANVSDIINVTSIDDSSDDDCPKLVPVLDEDGFQMYNPALFEDDVEQFSLDNVAEIISSDEEQPDSCEEEEYAENDDDDDDESMESIYEEISDDDSVISVSVNSKYLQDRNAADSSDDELPKRKQHQENMQAIVVNAEDLNSQHSIIGKSNMHVEEQEQAAEETPSENLMRHTEQSKLKASVVSIDIDISKAEKTNSSADFVTNVEELSQNNISAADESQLELNMKESAHLNSQISLNSEQKSFFINAMDSNDVLVMLKDAFYIYGTLRLTLLCGSVEIYGHTAQLQQEIEVFSPRGCSQLQIQPAADANTSKEQLKNELKLLESKFNRHELKKIAKQFDLKNDAIILLRRNLQRKPLINQFKKFMSENVFPYMSTIRADGPLYSSEYLLNCCINSHSERCLRIPAAWSSLPQMQQNTYVLLAGGKNVGKSTLLRYLINRQLSQQAANGVLLLDLDIGQSEIFVPQTICCAVIRQPLLGPACFLNLQPSRAYMLGYSNIMLCAHAYIRAVQQLVNYCRSNSEFSQMPWVINTMGYNKGFGLELLALICQLLQPTDVIQLQSNREINNFDVPLLQSNVLAAAPRCIYPEAEYNFAGETALNYRLHLLDAAVPQASRYQREWEMSAKDMRYVIILARLSDVLQGKAEWITDVKPFSASLDNLKIIHLQAKDATRDELLKALEVNLVYLCKQSDNAECIDFLECLGIGITRGLDHHIKQVYLLPAMPAAQLKSVNCLAMGEMPLPSSLFTNQGPKVANQAPYLYNTVADNASKSIKQIYHRPQKFLSGKHKNPLGNQA